MEKMISLLDKFFGYGIFTVEGDSSMTICLQPDYTIRDFLREMWPHTCEATIEEAAQVENKPALIGITTMPGSRTIHKCLEWLSGGPSYVVVLVPENADDEFIRSLIQYRCLVRRYPMKYLGIRKTRAWAEKNFPIPFCLSDDDLGNSYGGSYQFSPPKAVRPDDAMRSGGSRNQMDSDLFNRMVNIAIYFGNKAGCAYAGFNGSDQNTAALPGHEVPSSNPTNSFGTYGYEPFCYDNAITGFQMVLRPVRDRVPYKLRDVPQEFSTSCATAIGRGLGGTLSIQSILMHFAVNPPKDAEGAIRRLAERWPSVVERGNSAGGRDNDEKTGCIVHFKTRQAYAEPRGRR